MKTRVPVHSNIQHSDPHVSPVLPTEKPVQQGLSPFGLLIKNSQDWDI